MCETPLYEALVNHKNKDMSSFHTPGHKCRSYLENAALYMLDYTELKDTDSLFEAKGVIKKAEEKMAELYGAKSTLFSAGGCTLCIQAMLRLAVGYNGKVITSRMIHKSAVNTMALLGARPLWITPKFDEEKHLFKQVTSHEIEECLIQNKDAQCVYITSPNYYGELADIKAISSVCKKYDVPLLVDNAHGAHLGFLSNNQHPIYLGASMVADSAHKTLPVLTGGAFLHIKDEKFIKEAKSAMGLFGSTSPSYPIMASLDLCQDWARKRGREEFIRLESRVKEIKDLALKKGFIKEDQGIFDPLRLCLNTGNFGISGEEAAEYFRKNKIEPEFSDGGYVVLIPSPMNTDRDFKRLKDAILGFNMNGTFVDSKRPFPTPKIVVSLHEAIFMDREIINVRNAEGRVSAIAICPCPPGIPVLVPGEEINSNAIKSLEHYGIFEIDVIK